MLELLSPAGNADSLRAAINNGADAVYLGMKKFSARANAENFANEDLGYYIAYSKLFGVKVYVAANTLIKDEELDDYFDGIDVALRLGADAVIVQDMLLGKRLKREFPHAVFHLSTQAGVCNELGAELAAEFGFSRVILARETRLEDIYRISRIIETEAFVQGALCSSFSGHCYMSSFIGGNSGNRGLCKQPCRKKYTYYCGEKRIREGYSLSLADLCAADNLQKYIDAGVKSFKIEGRMRRPEYVAAATAYYRAALDGKDGDISAVKRTFNRNDYTEGLTFAQDKKFISYSVQGHIGEYVGRVDKIKDKRAFVGKLNGHKGDAYKILRNGKEVGSAVFISNDAAAAIIACEGNVCVGDEVRITSDYRLNARLLTREKKISVKIYATIKVGEKMHFAVESKSAKFIYEGEKADAAVNRPLTIEDLKECFMKTDKYPFEVEIDGVIENVFVGRSTLNEARRNIFEKLFCFGLNNNHIRIKQENNVRTISDRINTKKYCILNENIDIDATKILFPDDYKNIKKIKDAYLYLPAFADGKDLEIIKEKVKGFCGIYSDGYYGIALARKYGLKLIAGTGFNITNNISAAELGNADVVISKELSVREIGNFPASCAVLSLGSIALMDLIYCPFGKPEKCPVHGEITLEDEDKRKYKVRRYKISGCRFIVYNPYYLINEIKSDHSMLYDFSAMDKETLALFVKYADEPKKLKKLLPYTGGNLARGIK